MQKWKEKKSTKRRSPARTLRLSDSLLLIWLFCQISSTMDTSNQFFTKQQRSEAGGYIYKLLIYLVGLLPQIPSCLPSTLSFSWTWETIFKQAISPEQCVGSGIWIFIACWRRCRRFNLDNGVISRHSDSSRDLETANLLRASLQTQLSWTHIINVCLIKVVPFEDWVELWNIYNEIHIHIHHTVFFFPF